MYHNQFGLVSEGTLTKYFLLIFLIIIIGGFSISESSAYSVKLILCYHDSVYCPNGNYTIDYNISNGVVTTLNLNGCADGQGQIYQLSNHTWICSSAGSGTITGGQNTGKGTGSLGLYSGTSGSLIKLKNVTAGTGITLSGNVTDLTVSTSALLAAITTLNTDPSASQLLKANSALSNLTISDNGATHTWKLGSSVLISNGTDQIVTKSTFTINNLKLGGQLQLNGQTILNTGTITLPTATGTLALTSGVVSSFNTTTGGITLQAHDNGLTSTFSGGAYKITLKPNVGETNTTNNWSSANTLSGTSNRLTGTLINANNTMIFAGGGFGVTVDAQTQAVGNGTALVPNLKGTTDYFSMIGRNNNYTGIEGHTGKETFSQISSGKFNSGAIIINTPSGANAWQINVPTNSVSNGNKTGDLVLDTLSNNMTKVGFFQWNNTAIRGMGFPTILNETNKGISPPIKTGLTANSTGTLGSTYFTPTNAKSIFMIQGFVKITSFTSGYAHMVVTYTDDGGTATTQNIELMPNTGVPQSFATATGFFSGIPREISSNANLITCKVVISGTLTYTTSCQIIQVG